MFDVGFSELVLLFVIGLLILGPERLPRVAAQLGRWVGRARRTATQLRLQFEREMTMQDIMKQQRKPPPRDTQQPPSGAAAAVPDATPTAGRDPQTAGQDAASPAPPSPPGPADEPTPTRGRDATEADQQHAEPAGAAADQADDLR